MAMRMVPAFHPVMIFRRDRFGRGGDHTSFSQEGFAAVRFTEWLENFNHQHQDPRTENGVEYGDDIKFDDFNYIANVARLNSATLATLASAPGQPRKVAVLDPPYDTRTVLRWEKPAGFPAGATFEVVYRDTDPAQLDQRRLRRHRYHHRAAHLQGQRHLRRTLCRRRRTPQRRRLSRTASTPTANRWVGPLACKQLAAFERRVDPLNSPLS